MSNNINSLQLNNDKYDITNSEETTFARFKEKYESHTLVPGRTYIYSHISMSNLHAYYLNEVAELPSANNPFSLQIPYVIAVTATSEYTIDENIKVINAGPLFPRCSEWEVKYDLDVTKYDWTDKLNSATKVTSFEYLKNTYFLTDDDVITTVDDETCYTFRTTDNQLTMYGFYDYNANKFYICELEQDAFDGTYYSIVRSSINLVSNCSCGVITYLKDEYGNAMPFDFKCLMTGYTNNVGDLSTLRYEPWFKWNADDDYSYRNIINDNVDLSQNGTSTNNVVDEFYDAERHTYSIPRAWFFGPCHNNTVGKNNDEIRIGFRGEEGNSYGSSNNHIGDKCNTVYISESTAYNVLGNECSAIKIYPMSERNNFSGGCRNITIGTNSSSNTFGDMCRDIIMLDGCSYNTIGKGCAEMTMNNNVGFNTIGHHCYQLNFINGISHIDVENGTQNYTFGNNDVNYCMINKSTGRQIENTPSVVSQRIMVCRDDFASSGRDGDMFYHTIPLYVMVDNVMHQVIKPMMNAGYIPFEGDSFNIWSNITNSNENENIHFVSSVVASSNQSAKFMSTYWQSKSSGEISDSYPLFLTIGFCKSRIAEQVFMDVNRINGEVNATNFEFEIVGRPINTYKNFYDKYNICIEEYINSSGGEFTQKMILPIPNIDIFDKASETYCVADFIEILGIKNKGISFNVYSLYDLETEIGQNAHIVDILNAWETLNNIIPPVYSYIEGYEKFIDRMLCKDLWNYGYSSYIIEFWCDTRETFENLCITGLKLNYPMFGSNGITNQTMLKSKHREYQGTTHPVLDFRRASVPSVMITEDIVTDAVNELRNERTYTPCEIPDEKMGTHYIGNYEFVDLGLPSGTKWCNCNLGASSEEEVGDYFFFGCDKSVKEMVDEYNANPNIGYSLEEYIMNNVIPRQHKAFFNMGILDMKGSFISKTVSSKGTVYDTSTKRLGNSFATPSSVNWVELHENTNKRLFKKNGVFGILFISKNNGNTIFIPFNDIISALGVKLNHNIANIGVGCSLAGTDIIYRRDVFGEYPLINSATITTIPTSFGFPGAVQREGPPIIMASGIQEQNNQMSMHSAYPIRPISFI